MLMMLLAQIYLPPKASTVAPEVDILFNWILGVTAFFCLLIFVLMAVFAIKYRHRPGHDTQESTAHSTALELTWTIIPTIIALVIFYFGFKGFLDESVVPPNAYPITVHSHMWSWGFVYPNGYLSDELHIYKGRPIRLVLTSNDVVHSLYMPAMRVQKMTVPGRYNHIWIEATKTGTFPIYCAQYCGTKHSEMLSKVVVHKDEAEFAKWLEDASDLTKNPLFKERGPSWAGEQVMKSHGCFQCHSVNGTAGTGPSLKDVFGSEQLMSDGKTVLADENYVHESVLYPQAKIVKGFGPVMPSFLGTLKDQDIDWIIAYLESISTHYKRAALIAPPAGAKPSDTKPAGAKPASGAPGAPAAPAPAPK